MWAATDGDAVTERRRSVRLPAYDYTSPGAYFVTVCAHGRRCIFDAPEVRHLVEERWNQTRHHFPNAATDEFVIMPNHVHGILWIVGANTAVGTQHAASLQTPSVAPGSLGAIVRSFKSAVTKPVNEILGTPGAPVWQRNYYERIIRNEDELRRVREYIRFNPLQWDFDRENPHRVLNAAHEREWSWLEGTGGPGRGETCLAPTPVAEGQRS